MATWARREADAIPVPPNATGARRQRARRFLEIYAPGSERPTVATGERFGVVYVCRSVEVANPTGFAPLNDARSTVTRIRKVIRSGYRKWRAGAKAAAASLLQISQNN